MGGTVGNIASQFDPTTATGLANIGTMGGYGAMGGGGAGGKTGKGAPAPPDFAAAAEAQAASGHQNTPFATWGENGMEFTGGLGAGAENLMNQIGSQGALPTGAEARQQAIDSAYGAATSRLDPMYGQRESELRSRLANQGLDPGSEAADSATANLGRERTDAYSQAMANAIGQGTQAGNAIFQQGVQSQNLPYQQIGQLASLLGLNNGPQTQYLNAANAGYQGQQNQYATQQAGLNSKMGAGASLAPLAIMASDERLKKNIERSEFEAMPGVPFASWEWIDGPPGRFRGVIAQDLERVAPEWVHTGPAGMKFVNYGFLGVDHG